MIDVDTVVKMALVAVAAIALALYASERMERARIIEAASMTVDLADRCVAEIQGASEEIAQAIESMREGR